MRLSNRIKKVVIQAVKNVFGDVKIYLFGSRTDDNKLGGDIDIAVKTILLEEEFRKKKALFFTFLTRLGYDIKIDIVQYNSLNPLLFEEIQKNSIELI